MSNCKHCAAFGKESKTTKIYRSLSESNELIHLCDSCYSYIVEREKLITRANRYANETCGRLPNGETEDEREEWVGKWNFFFLQKMQELSKENGLIK
jgi:hypothetical protein